LPDHPYDPFHFNSVDKDELGNYLVSARYTHAVYYISGSTMPGLCNPTHSPRHTCLRQRKKAGRRNC
jgi:hypothetical protein